MIEQTLAVDITRVFQSSIERGLAFEIGDLQIIADKLVVQSRPGDTGADTRMLLFGVAAADLDSQGRIVTDVTAAQAVVDIHRRDGRTFIKLAMTDTVAYRANTGELLEMREFTPNRAFVVPTPLRDSPKAMTRAQLLRLRSNPDEYTRVIQARRDLADSLRVVRTRQAINQRLTSTGNVLLSQGGHEGVDFVVYAEELGPERFLSRGGKPLEIVQYRGHTPELRIRPRAVFVTPRIGGPFQDLSFDLRLEDCQVTDLVAGGAPNQRARLELPGLIFAETVAAEAEMLSSNELIARADALRTEGGGINAGIRRVQEEIQRLGREIRARLTNRYALSVTAALLLLLGGVLAMWLRGSLPLTIYLWAFLPAILDLILISAGEQLMRDDRLLAPYVMWSGNAILLIVLVTAYVRLCRN